MIIFQKFGVGDIMKKTSRQNLYKLLIGVTLLVFAFLYNKLFSPKNEIFVLVNIFLTLIFIGFGFVFIYGSLSLSKNKSNHLKENDNKVLKVWSIDELFAFLEKEQEMIDLIIENDGQLHIGITTDFERIPFSNNTSYSKYYYLEENVYDDFIEFKSAFLNIFKKNVVAIYYAGIEDMPIKI